MILSVSRHMARVRAYTAWSDELYMMALKNIRFRSRWNSSVDLREK
jgi:hypothetical protein